LTSDEPLTYKSDWFELDRAFLQVKPYKGRDLEIVTASSISPSGMKLAGKHSLGVISVASYSVEGLAALPTQWGFAETYAEETGGTVSRDNWRVMMPWHIAETREQAIAEVKHGLVHWHNEYNVNTLARPGSERVEPDRVDGFVEAMIARGGAIIGSPDDAVDAIHKLSELTGGFGTLVGFMHDWASHEATLRSYDMMARYVVPKVTRALDSIERSRSLLQSNNTALMEAAGRGIIKAIRDHNKTHPRD
jgi:limonene 1,2-monooxygenase